MDSTKPIFFLFLISLLLFKQISAFQVCSNSFCRRTEPIIRFPFGLQNHQPTTCGYPGFDLFCDAFNQTLIELPNSGEFAVQGIDYADQNIWLNDPNHCLPKRLLNLNITGSPFSACLFQEFTLFNCAFGYKKYRFDPIPCLSGDNYTVFASSSARTIRFMASRCNLMATVAVPVPVQWSSFQPVLTSDLSDDIQLAWGSPWCRRCEARRGRCVFQSGNSTVIECRNMRHRLPRTVRYAIIVGASAGLLVFLCLIGMLCFLCRRVENRLNYHHHHPIMEFSMVVAPQPATTTTTVSGLDGQTIESYPKTILGESRRLPKPDYNICAICLSEYMPKETLRSIPECQHCFHAECIDEWLRLNSSCPVCRNSPENSPPPPVS